MVFIYVGSWRRVLAIAVAAGLVVGIAFGALAITAGDSALVFPASSGKLVPVYKVARQDRALSITVDATWGDDRTLALLDLFDRCQIKVTFFLAGHWIKSYPDMVREIASRGHELGNHSWTHPNMGGLSQDKIHEEVELTQSAIQEITGTRPKLFRPPFGDYSNNLITQVERCGLTTVQWSVDSLDWKDLTAQQIYDRVMPAVHPGAIILFHNAGKYTVEALDLIIPKLKADGYSIVPVSQLLLTGETYIDRNTGEQRLCAPQTLQKSAPAPSVPGQGQPLVESPGLKRPAPRS